MTLYKKILSNTAIYASGIMLGKLSSFLLLPLYTRYLTPSDYGVLELVELSFIVASVVGMRLGEAFFYFYFRAETAEARARVLSTAILGSGAIGLAATVVFWLLAAQVSLLMFQTTEYEFYFRLMFAALGFSFLQDIGFCYFRALDKAGTFVWVATAKLVLTLILNVLFLVWYRMGLPAMLWSGVIASAATSAGLVIYCLARVRIVFDRGLFRQFCTYGAPMAASGLGLLFMHYADRIFLQRCATLAEVGIYSLGYKIGMLTAYIWAAFGSYWNAQIFEIIKRKNSDFIYVRVFTYFALAATGGALALSVFARPLIRIMATSAFAPAALFVAPIAAAYAVKGTDDFLRTVFLVEKRTGLNARVTWAGVVVCFVAYASLVPRFKAWGAVVATCGSFAFMALLSWYEAQRVQAFRFEYARLLRIGICAAVVFGVWFAVHPEGLVVEILLSVALLLSFPVLLWATGFCEAREVAAIRAVLSRLRNAPAPVQLRAGNQNC